MLEAIVKISLQLEIFLAESNQNALKSFHLRFPLISFPNQTQVHGACLQTAHHLVIHLTIAHQVLNLTAFDITQPTFPFEGTSRRIPLGNDTTPEASHFPTFHDYSPNLTPLRRGLNVITTLNIKSGFAFHEREPAGFELRGARVGSQLSATKGISWQNSRPPVNIDSLRQDLTPGRSDGG